MKKILIVPLLLLALFVAVSSAPQVHALPNGVVCVNLATVTPAACNPSTPASFTGAVGTKFVVAVNIFNSSAFNGFEISLHVDPTVLKPLNATVDGSIVPTLPGTVFTAYPVNCVNNGNGLPLGILGNLGCTAADGNGTTTFALVSVGGFSAQPITGRLFTATYQVVGLSSGTLIGYVVTGTPTATGTATCTGGSLLNYCVTIANGRTGVSVPESLAEPAICCNPPPLHPTATVVICSTPVFVNRGSPCTATVIDTSVIGATTPTGTVGFTVATGTGSITGSPCLLVLIVVQTGGTASCSVTFTPATFATATVTGTYSGDSVHAPSLGTSNIIGTVQPSTSTVVSCTTPVLVNRPSTCTATVTSAISPTPAGTVGFVVATGTGTISGSPCTLSAAGTCSVTFTGSVVGTATVTGTYTPSDSVHAASSGTSNTIFIQGGQISLSCSPSSLTIATGTSGTCTLTIGGFSGIVALTNSSVPAGVTLSFSTTSVTVPPTATSTLTIAVACSVLPSTFSVTVTGTSGTTPPNSTLISVTVPTAPGCASFVGGKLSWTHHLSLAKNANTQSFTAKVTNFEAVGEYLQVFISGTSGSASFTCPSSTATAFETSCASAPVLFTAGSSGTITISLVLTLSNVGLKFHFTAILEFSPTLTSTGSLLNPQTSNAKSGAFAVVA